MGDPKIFENAVAIEKLDYFSYDANKKIMMEIKKDFVGLSNKSDKVTTNQR